jgi:3',5'-cyclic AMP phosphodiesterase CpdA
VSTYGDTFHDRARIVKRSAMLADTSPARFDVVWEEAGWKVLHARGGKPSKVTLIDPEGYAHPVPSVKQLAEGDLDPVERAAAKACRLESRRAATLGLASPTDGALALMLRSTPKNTNLRLLRAARAVAQSAPDVVVITGDLTDDGDGYELVKGAFSRFVDKGRLLAIPGNHDLYLFPIAGSGRPRATAESKRKAWQAFAKDLGLELDACGAFTRELPQGDAIVVGLDSCARAQRSFFRQNGAIGSAQLEYLRKVAGSSAWKKAHHKIVLLHHHVVPLPHGVGKRAPTEFAMRLDDATAVAEVLNEVGATLVMHGHRHVSEERQPAGSNFRILASPSLTLGCRSGDVPSFWRVELAEHAHATRVRIAVAAVEQEDDPTLTGGPPPGSPPSEPLI